MTVFQRWIAIVPACLAAMVALPGCKTGTKRFSCQSANCAATACAKSSCIKGGCEKTGCGSTKVACAKTSGCKTLFGSRDKSPCAPKAGCAPKVSCGAGCSTVGRATCTPSVKIVPRSTTTTIVPVPQKMVPHEMKSEEVVKPNPFESKPMPKPTPMKPEYEDGGEELPLPLPAPPAAEKTSQADNPFLRVAQNEVENSARVISSASMTYPGEEDHGTSPFPVDPAKTRQDYSRPWADAMGLPDEGDADVKAYRK